MHFLCTLTYFSPEYEAPAPLPETTENAVCALGLIVAPILLVAALGALVLNFRGMEK